MLLDKSRVELMKRRVRVFLVNKNLPSIADLIMRIGKKGVFERSFLLLEEKRCSRPW
jgi:hypothetical protein